MTSNTSLPRGLIAFAFVEEEYARSGDLVRGLWPLFAPLLERSTHRRFDPEDFARSFEHAYDVPMSSLVAEGLVPQLVSAGLLVSEGPDNPHVYRVADFEYLKPRERPEESAKLEAVLEDFVAFSRERITRASLTVSDEALRDGLLKRLTDLNFLTFLERPDRNYFKGRKLVLGSSTNHEESVAEAEQALDVLSAEFALHVHETDSAKFELLTKLVKGALVAEVVLTLQNPSADADLSAVTLILDGPLILDLLDVSTPELKDYSQALFELVDRAKLSKTTFLHTIEEMEGTIRGPLDAMQRGERPFGPLGNRILNSKSHAAYARAILTNLRDELSRRDIHIVDAASYEEAAHAKHCPEAVEDSLRNDFGLEPQSFERRQRDARSIATVLRMRGGVAEPLSMHDAGFVMVTRNPAVASRSQKVLIYKNCATERAFPAVLTDRQLAGLLWFAVGGNLGALSRTKLIANCSAALNPRTDIATKLSQYLYEVDPQKAETFAALMRDKRARRSLVRETLAFPAAITRDNAEELLEQMRLATADAERRAAQAREAEQRATHEARLAEMASHHQAELFALRGEVLSLSGERTRSEQSAAESARLQAERVARLESALDGLNADTRRSVEERVAQAASFANKTRKRLKVEIVVLYAAIVLVGMLAPSAALSARLLSATLALAGFWIVPQLIFEKPLDLIWKRQFLTRARQLDVEKHLAEFELDVRAGSVRRK